jgi:hypothetical protein
MTIACTLTSTELRARREHIAGLARVALRSRRPAARGEQLVFDPAAAAALRELVALEAECCPFLTLDLRPASDGLVLTITGPEEAGSGARVLGLEGLLEPLEVRDL